MIPAPPHSPMLKSPSLQRGVGGILYRYLSCQHRALGHVWHGTDVFGAGALCGVLAGMWVAKWLGVL